MDKWIKIILVTFLTLFALPQSFAEKTKPTQDLNTPVGYWKTIDDVSGKPKAVLQILKTENQQLYGRILKTFPENNKEPAELCTHCPGERHNRPIVGMIILENLKQDNSNGTQWSGGQILDPKSGKIYHCTLKVIDNGQKLSVRGYIGLPLFGRSQTWLRITDPNKA